MRVMTFNANGLRSAAKKGFFDWFLTQNIDVLCLQELKAQTSQLEDEVFKPTGYQRFFETALKPGYSGVGIYTRLAPDAVHRGLGFACADTEGRYLQLDFGDLSIVSLYLPSGSSGEHRQAEKFEFMKQYQPILARQVQEARRYIVCGDWNIVHREIDIKNFKTNQKTSGCLPEEREWVEHLISDLGWVDAFRVLNPGPDQYTWWSVRAMGARDRNIGWRIDYQLVSPQLRNSLRQAAIYKDPVFSDHAPCVVEFDL